MQKIILDTNVIISDLVSNSIPTKILYDLVLNKVVETHLSKEVYQEYLDVLNRNKFAKYDNFKINASFVLNKFREISFFFKTTKKISILDDMSDNKFLELAHVSKADFLITGNINDFKLSTFDRTTVLTPREYWDFHSPYL